MAGDICYAFDTIGPGGFLLNNRLIGASLVDRNTCVSQVVDKDLRKQVQSYWCSVT